MSREFTFDAGSDYLSRDSGLHRLTVELLQQADIRIGGNRPWDMQLKAGGVPERVFAQGNLGLGEAYMEGAWEAERLDEFFFRLLRADIDRQVKPARLIFHTLRSRLLNRQNRRRAGRSARPTTISATISTRPCSIRA